MTKLFTLYPITPARCVELSQDYASRCAASTELNEGYDKHHRLSEFYKRLPTLVEVVATNGKVRTKVYFADEVPTILARYPDVPIFDEVQLRYE